MASHLVGFFNQPHNQTIVDNLAALLTLPEFVVKASFAEAKAHAERLGAKVTGSVINKTDYVVAGEDPGGKARNAKELGIKVLSEDEFVALMGE